MPPKRSATKARPEATPEDILAGHRPDVVALAERLRALVKDTVPDAREVAYPGWHAIGYRHPQAGYFCGVFPHEDRVHLLFERGVMLPDPDRILTGDGRQVRYVLLRPGDDLPEPAVRRLLLLASMR